MLALLERQPAESGCLTEKSVSASSSHDVSGIIFVLAAFEVAVHTVRRGTAIDRQ